MCATKPNEIFSHLLDFRVPEIMKTAGRDYCFTGLSAIEVWSDYSYVQRDIKRSPYFVKVLEKDIRYWKGFFAAQEIQVYEKEGTTIGEFVVLIPVRRVAWKIKDNLKVEPLNETMENAGKNELYEYAYNYMRENYGQNATA